MQLSAGFARLRDTNLLRAGFARHGAGGRAVELRFGIVGRRFRAVGSHYAGSWRISEARRRFSAGLAFKMAASPYPPRRGPITARHKIQDGIFALLHSVNKPCFLNLMLSLRSLA